MQEAEDGTGAGATVEPEHGGPCGGVGDLGLREPVVELGAGFRGGRVEEPAVLRRWGRAVPGQVRHEILSGPETVGGCRGGRVGRGWRGRGRFRAEPVRAAFDAHRDAGLAHRRRRPAGRQQDDTQRGDDAS